MSDFLIHRDTDGQIVQAIPYANITRMILSDESYCGEEWRVDFTLQNMQGCSLQGTKEQTERYLAEWRAWWERKVNV